MTPRQALVVQYGDHEAFELTPDGRWVPTTKRLDRSASQPIETPEGAGQFADLLERHNVTELPRFASAVQPGSSK